MTQWNITVSDKIDRGAKGILSRRGGNLSELIERLVGQAIFWDTVDVIKDRNKDLSAEEIQRLADEAVADYRANRP